MTYMDYQTAYHAALAWAIIASSLSIGLALALLRANRMNRQYFEEAPPVHNNQEPIILDFEEPKNIVEDEPNPIIKEEAQPPATETVNPRLAVNWEDKPIINHGHADHDRPNFRD